MCLKTQQAAHERWNSSWKKKLFIYNMLCTWLMSAKHENKHKIMSFGFSCECERQTEVFFLNRTNKQHTHTHRRRKGYRNVRQFSFVCYFLFVYLASDLPRMFRVIALISVSEYGKTKIGLSLLHRTQLRPPLLSFKWGRVTVENNLI